MSPANGVEGLAPGQSLIKIYFYQPIQGLDEGDPNSIKSLFPFIQSAHLRRMVKFCRCRWSCSRTRSTTLL